MPPINFQVTPSGPPKFEPYIAVNLLSTNIMIAVSVDTTSGVPQIGLYRSLDGGADWTNALLPLPPGFTGAEAPAVAYQFPTTFIVTAHAFPGESDGTVIAYLSTDNGATFSAPFIVAPGYGTYINNDETNVTVDNSQSSPYLGNIYVSYNHQFNIANSARSTAFIQSSTDDGATFETPSLLSSTADTVERPDASVALTGVVYAAWVKTNNPAQFMIKTSQDGGAHFGSSIIVSNVVLVPSPLPVTNYNFRVLTYANVAADRSNGSMPGVVYAVWQDYRQGYADIFMSKSIDFAVTWSTPVSITQAPVGSQNFFPAVDVDPLTGTVNVIYYTNRLDGFNLDVFSARSIDYGASFVNQRVTTQSFDPNAGSPTPVTIIGDYIDVASVPPYGYIGAWTDTRTGTQTIFVGYNTDPATP
ncbi:exo-alpha-sialidase [Paenibacillus athensensis]|uniref:Exo-alpha-sialidase n=1 Tax=Paenibacillus athensensis TaxID=1967502 RepID=A0A4Y8PWF8_9BACL|nr:sialidase family protein [Paenibacillus athensensis]MCD1260597.1 exo-alpha-sialidase [Paenibacillus athensensis]